MAYVIKKKDFLTVPNLLSMFRIVLIPFIIWSYVDLGNHYLAVGLVALSALTDVLDGQIARRCNQITDLGKIIDPLADKLTQAAMIICLSSRYAWMWMLISLFVVKEIISASFGYLSLKTDVKILGAQWFGKVNTVLLYGVMIILFLLPDLNIRIVNGLIFLCSISLSVTFFLYIRFFWGQVKLGTVAVKDLASPQAIGKLVSICLWMLLVLFCLVYRDRITMEAILNIVPKNSMGAAAVMMLLFAAKSVAVFVYAGLLFAANGVLFSLPVALLLNILGCVVMFSLPYFIARKNGAAGMQALAQKHPDVSLLQGFPTESKFFLCFITRIIGILPADVVSAYMGSVRTPYGFYLLGSVLGMSVSVTTFTVMGMSVQDPSSPTFYVSLIVELAVNGLSLLCYLLYRRKRKAK